MPRGASSQLSTEACSANALPLPPWYDLGSVSEWHFEQLALKVEPLKSEVAL